MTTKKQFFALRPVKHSSKPTKARAMKFILSLLAAAATLALAGAATAATPITLQDQGGNLWSATFEGSTSANLFSLDLSSFTSVLALNGIVTANFVGGSGYDVTAVKFDSTPFTAIANTTMPGVFGVDAWTLSLGSVSTTLHTLQVDGMQLGTTGKFTGSIGVQVTPVPEPETYAMMMAGLGALGFLARRRNSRSDNA